MLVPYDTLILVVDGSRVKIFRNQGSAADIRLDLLAEDRLDNPASHVLGTSGPGRSFESSGVTSHAFSAPDIHQRREDRFAAEALEELCRKVHDKPGAIVVAPPHMLGILREKYDERVRGRILAEIDKDLTHLRDDEIAKFLHGHFC